MLENELRHRLQVERPRIIRKLAEARTDDSDLAKNAEYHAAPPLALEAVAHGDAHADLGRGTPAQILSCHAAYYNEVQPRAGSRSGNGQQ